MTFNWLELLIEVVAVFLGIDGSVDLLTELPSGRNTDVLLPFALPLTKQTMRLKAGGTLFPVLTMVISGAKWFSSQQQGQGRQEACSFKRFIQESTFITRLSLDDSNFL